MDLPSQALLAAGPESRNCRELGGAAVDGGRGRGRGRIRVTWGLLSGEGKGIGEEVACSVCGEEEGGR